MRLVNLKQHKRTLISVLTLLLIGVMFFAYSILRSATGGESTNSKETAVKNEVLYVTVKEIDDARKRSGIPFKNGSVESTNLDYYWINETVVDGSFKCFVYDKETYQLYGSTYTTAGFGSPSRSGRTFYQNQEYPLEYIEEIIESACRGTNL